MVPELCLAWVCVHPLVVAQQAEEGGGNVLLAAHGVGCLLGGEPGGEPCPIPREKGGAMGWPMLWVWDRVLPGSVCWSLG